MKIYEYSKEVPIVNFSDDKYRKITFSDGIALKSLKDSLEGVITDDCYSILGYSDDAICIDKNMENYWEVYVGTIGKAKDKIIYDNVLEACFNLISRLSDSKNYANLVNNIFIENFNGNVNGMEVFNFIKTNKNVSDIELQYFQLDCVRYQLKMKSLDETVRYGRSR